MTGLKTLAIDRVTEALFNYSGSQNIDLDGQDPLESHGHGLRYDYISHINAVRSLLWRQEHVDSQLEDRIERSEEVARKTGGEANELAVDHHIELLQASVYQSATHSMAAVGMLAPLAESVFRNAFQCIGKDLPRSDLARNIIEVISGESHGLAEHMPKDLKPTLEALFQYRNKMFHNGLEWPPQERRAFATNVSEWPDGWFGDATMDNEPWMFYMSPEFISHCIATIEEVLRGFIRFQQGPGRKVWQYPDDVDY